MTAYPRHAFDVAPGRARPSLAALVFRRVLRLPRRAAHPAPLAAPRPLPLYLVRPAGGAVVVDGNGRVSLVAPRAAGAPPWQTAAMPALDDEGYALAQMRSEYLRSHLRDCERPTPQLLERLRDALRAMDAEVTP